ncbi:hypothetical protein RND81_02G087300 [Saponaria officinalis]|uniref:Uncharacterized protein n=1 Tax=Saponaria officinalis TaxID=3572 RepID=A0AAW1MTZ8_SAPOF
MSRLTNLAIVLHVLSILCFFLWFWSMFVTLRDHYKNWTLLIAFSICSLCFVFIPLLFLCTLLQSTAYANFWGVPKDEAPLKTWDYDLVSGYIPEAIQSMRYMFVGIAVFLYVWAFFAIINTRNVIVGWVAILSSALGGYCVGELFKVGPTPRHALTWAGAGAVDFGFFNYVIANAICKAQRLFGLNTKSMWCVCLVHSF